MKMIIPNKYILTKEFHPQAFNERQNFAVDCEAYDPGNHFFFYLSDWTHEQHWYKGIFFVEFDKDDWYTVKVLEAVRGYKIPVYEDKMVIQYFFNEFGVMVELPKRKRLLEDYIRKCLPACPIHITQECFLR